MTSDQLAAETAAALSRTIPRVRISQLDDCDAVAHGVFAWIDSALEEIDAAGIRLDSQQRRWAQIRGLAECLRIWQANTLEAAIAGWLRDHPRRSVLIHNCTGSGAIGVWVEDPGCYADSDRWYGEGRTVGAALAGALSNYDSEGSEVRESGRKEM